MDYDIFQLGEGMVENQLCRIVIDISSKIRLGLSTYGLGKIIDGSMF